MKKKSIILSVILFSFLFFACSKSATMKNDKEKELEEKRANLGIKFQKVYGYKYKDNLIDENSEFLLELLEYNKKGQLIRAEYYDTYPNGEKHIMKLLYEVDEYGNPISMEFFYDSDEVNEIFKYEYENGVLSEITVNSSEGDLTQKMRYTYDNNGNIIKQISFNSDGDAVYRVIRDYDKSSEEIEYKRYGENNVLTEHYRLINIEGNKKIYQWFDERGGITQTTNKFFNENNLLIREEVEEVSPRGIINSSIEYKYDNNEFLIEQIYFDGNDNPEIIKKTVWETF